MIALKVVVDGTQYILETYENDPINLKLQYSNIENIQSAVGTFSQSFRIPATDNNRAALGNFDLTNEVGGYNPKMRVEAWIEEDTIPVVSGFIQLVSAVVHKDEQADFKITFYGESANLFKALGDDKLVGLDLSEYDYDLTFANFELGQAGTLFSGDVRHCLMDKGRVWNNAIAGQFLDADNPAQLSDLAPLLRARVIMNKIMENAGYTMESSFFDSALFDDIYTAAFNGSVFQLEADALNINFHVGLSGADEEIVGTFNGATPFFPEDFVDSGTGFNGVDYYNPAGMYDTTDDTLTVPIDGVYELQCRIETHIEFPFMGSPEISFIQAVVYDVTNPLVPIVVNPIGGGSSLGSAFDTGSPALGIFLVFGTKEYELDSSKTYTIGLAPNGEAPTGGAINHYIKVTGQGSSWQGSLVDAYGGQTVDMASNMPDYKQSDYVRDMQKMFNLVFVPDVNDPAKIYVEPFDDYQSTGVIKDWNDYVNSGGKDYTITSTASLQSREYEWRFSDGEDFISKGTVVLADRTYGRYLIEDTANDFATGTRTIQPGHQPLSLSTIFNSAMVIHKALDNEGRIIKKPKPMTGFYNNYTIGGVDNPSNIGGLFLNDQGTTEQVDDFPYWGHFENPYPQPTDLDLNFGDEFPYPDVTPPANNLYRSYWENYVLELYSDEARIMECDIYLTTAQIADFKWNDIIFIKGEYWRALSLDYSPNTNKTTKVKLIKRIFAARACEWSPVSVGEGSLVTFEDSNGVLGTPTQECCEFYDYIWSNGACYGKILDGGPGDTIAPPIDTGNTLTGLETLRYTSVDLDSTAGSTVIVDTTSDVTITLPIANNTPGETVTIVRLEGTGVLSIVGINGTDTVNNNATDKIYGDNVTVTYKSVGGGAWVKAADGGASDLQNRIVVNQDNFATTLGGTIDSTKQYFIDGDIEVGSTTIVVPSSGLTIDGYGFDLSKLTSSETGFALFTSPVGGSGNLLITNISMEITGTTAKVYDLIADTGFEAVEVNTCNYNDCTSLGVIEDYRQGLESGTGRFSGTPELELEGTWIGGFRITTSIARGVSSSTLFKAGSSLVMGGRFLSDINMEGETAATFCDFAPANITNNATFLMNNANFRGVTNPLPNMPASSVKARFSKCVGIRNTYIGSRYSVTTGATTTIATVDTPVKMAGTTTYTDEQWFASTVDNALLYVSDQTIDVEIKGVLSFSGGANDQMSVCLRQWDDSASAYVDLEKSGMVTMNGGGGNRAEGVSFLGYATLDENDRIEVWIENNSDTTNIDTETEGVVSVQERAS